MQDLASICDALSDPGRLRIVAALFPGELCVCQILELLELAPSTVSKHLAILRAAGLIDARKEGRWMYYRIADQATPVARSALRWLRSSLSASPQAKADSKQLKAICRMNTVALCCRQREARCC
jgi:DNA-binding transcriptional ArsR family regulator